MTIEENIAWCERQSEHMKSAYRILHENGKHDLADEIWTFDMKLIAEHNRLVRELEAAA